MNNLKFSNSVLTNIIISSIIPFLIWGPFFPDLIVSVFSLFFLFYVIKNKKFYFFKNKPLIIFFIFCIYCIFLSIFIAEDTRLSLESSLFYFRAGVFSCFIWYLINKNKNILTYFYYSLVICFSVLVIDGYIQFFTENNLIGLKKTDLRISSFFGDELIMGSYLSRLFPLLFALFLIKKKQKYEIYFIGILFILVDMIIFLSGERSSFFFLNLSTVFIIILIKEYQRFRLATLILSIICIFILSLYSTDYSLRMFKEPLKAMVLPDKSKERVIFTPQHDSLIRTAYNMFEDQPLTGHGPKMFRVICKKEKYAIGVHSCSTHPHNFYAQLSAETGIIGLSFLFIVLIYVLYKSFIQLKSIILRQKRPLTDFQVCLLAGIFITVWPFTSNGNFFNNWLMIVYSLPIGFYLHSVYQREFHKTIK